MSQSLLGPAVYTLHGTPQEQQSSSSSRGTSSGAAFRPRADHGGALRPIRRGAQWILGQPPMSSPLPSTISRVHDAMEWNGVIAPDWCLPPLLQAPEFRCRSAVYTTRRCAVPRAPCRFPSAFGPIGSPSLGLSEMLLYAPPNASRIRYAMYSSFSWIFFGARDFRNRHCSRVGDPPRLLRGFGIIEVSGGRHYC